MRRIILAFIGFMLAVTLVAPVVIVRGCNLAAPVPGSTDLNQSGLTLRVYRVDLQKTVEMDLEEYVKGVVAAEMPASFEPAALATQALVARTFAIKRMKIFGGKGCNQHPDADICTDPTHDQGWATEAELKKTWGFIGYYRQWARIGTAVQSTAGKMIVCSGEAIDPVYHSTCGGHTENSEDVWSEKISYLRGVVCDSDGDSPRLKETKKFTLDQVETAVGLGAGALTALSRTDKSKVVQVTATTTYGRVKEVRIGDKVVAGADLRTALGLRSTKLTVSWDGAKLRIDTTGYGHGVGLCQYGANGLAKRGLSFDEIVKHYYTGVEIVPIFDE